MCYGAFPNSEPIAFPEPDPDDVFVPAEPVLVMRRRTEEVEDAAEEEPRQTLIAPLDEDPLPLLLRPLAWINAPVIDMGARARVAVSCVSALSFAASLWALVYVLMLRAQNG